jgi:valyl-tRNA synthetase
MDLRDLPKQYDPQDAQRRCYQLWLDNGYFHARPESDRPPYCIVIPPPNVTGALHLGHALNNTLQDILIRWRRMQGYDVLWMPGTDHAGIATQAVVEKRLFEEEKKTRHDLGRAALVERIWAWKDEYEARILSQLRLLGCSCDWERTRFTLDPICSRAVRRTFFNLFKAGRIFRGKRLVNWDTQLRTAVADDEIYYEEVQGHLWTIKYPIADAPSGEVLHIATTRPETMLGDTAVAVHPDDPRYQRFIGKQVDLPLTGRQIPIIADPKLVDPAFGTGAVKVTPGHDPNDYQAGLRNGLPMINLLNPDGTYNENAGNYKGLDRLVVRKRVVEDLKALGLLERVDSYLVRLNHSDRSKTPIEPYLSDQWFVRMGDDPDGSPGFAQEAMDAVTSGRIKIHPERYAKSYLDWLGEKRDWCISRQLWWGHRIPVWTKAKARVPVGPGIFPPRTDSTAFPGTTQFGFLSEEEHRQVWSQDQTDPETGASFMHVCVADGNVEIEDKLIANGYEQDPDVLDTWFSSALWPHSTLGWPEETPELAKYYPTSVLSTARDIITLWVARMVIFGLFNRSEVPFRDVYIHPVIQDGFGRRMSKSAGNGVDPVDIIEIHGTDALRYTLAAGATETQDLRMPVEKLKVADGRTVNTSERFEQGRNFANKFWNAARFALMNLEGFAPAELDPRTLPVEDRWILDCLDRAIAGCTDDLNGFQFAEASRRLRDFIWGDFCDWYLEFVKGRLRDPAARPVAQNVLATVLDGLARLLHPIMPFVTEQVWQALNSVAPRRGLPQPNSAEASVCIAQWPRPLGFCDESACRIVEEWREVTKAIRNLRAERNVPKDSNITPVIIAQGAVAEWLEQGETYIRSLTAAGLVTIVPAADRPPECAVAVLPDVEIILPLAGLIDHKAEAAKLKKALADLDRQLPGLEGKLKNESFLARAPADVVEQTRAKLAELRSQREAIARVLHGT